MQYIKNLWNSLPQDIATSINLVLKEDWRNSWKKDLSIAISPKDLMFYLGWVQHDSKHQ